MRVTHYASRWATVVLALALAACGKDSSAPSEFNPQGTTADMTAAQAAFQAPQMSSFAVLGGSISAVLNGSPVVKASALAVRGLDAARAARDLAAIVPRPGVFQASVTSIPSDLLGTTFVWDVATAGYVSSDLTGAPSQGVRFLLYAVDPVMLQPVDPLVEVGYVDITDHSSMTAVDVNVRVVEGSVVYLDYNVTAHPSTNGGTLEISGFATDGATLANFDLTTSVTQTSNSVVIDYGYQVNVPSRHLTLTWTITMSSVSGSEFATTLDLVIDGPNGNVRLTGGYGVTERTLTVNVNGAVFATVNLDGPQPVITGADGQPLSAEDEASLEAIVGFFVASGGMLDGLQAL